MNKFAWEIDDLVFEPKEHSFPGHKGRPGHEGGSSPRDLPADWQGHPNWKQRAYGGVIVDGDKILLREPANHFDGYHWTFAKGKMDHPSEDPAVAAKREVREETGHDVDIKDYLPGTYLSGSGSTLNLFIMHSKGQVTEHDDETWKMKWATPDEARALISQSTNKGGRERDLAILDATVAHLGLKKHAWDESKHPRHPKGSEGGGEFAPGNAAIKERMVDMQARVFGVPSGTDTKYGGHGYHFKVGDKEYVAAGQFDPTTNEVTIYDEGFRFDTEGELHIDGGVLAHELQHAKFNQWTETALRERALFTNSPINLQRKWIEAQDVNLLPALGTLNEEGRKRFPRYALLQKYADPAFQTALQKADGVTEYSKSYWADYASSTTLNSSGVKTGFSTAVNETLAEVARLKHNGMFSMAHQIWRQFYNDIDKFAF